MFRLKDLSLREIHFADEIGTLKLNQVPKKVITADAWF
jgi:hypothetical protein